MPGLRDRWSLRRVRPLAALVQEQELTDSQMLCVTLLIDREELEYSGSPVVLVPLHRTSYSNICRDFQGIEEKRLPHHHHQLLPAFSQRQPRDVG